MAYQGWDREKMLASVNVPDGPSNINHKNTTSFTPVNHYRTPLPPSSSLDPIEKGLNSHSLYELREEPAPTIPIRTSKKRKPPPKGRVVSLASVWEYKDKEDIYNHGVPFEEPIPKRKKTAVSKRSQSMKIPPTIHVEWDDDKDRNGAVDQQEQNHDQQGSQLTAPPDSRKRKKAEDTSVPSKTKAKLTPPFKNPTITKSSVPREKEIVVDVHRSNSIINYNGWKSTEVSMKSSPVVLAKTTMEKLAAFRFKPASDAHTMPVSRSVLQQRVTQEEDDLPQHEPLREGVHISSDYDLPSDSFFDEALWAVKAHTKFSDVDQIQAEPTTALTPVTGGSEGHKEQRTPEIGSHIIGSVIEPLARDPVYPGSVLARQQPGSHPNDCYEPTSSEARVFNDLTIFAQPELGKLAKSVLEYVDSTSTTVQPVGSPSQLNTVGNIDLNRQSDVAVAQFAADELLIAHNSAQESVIGYHSGGPEIRDDVLHRELPDGLNAPPSSQSNGHDELPKQKDPFPANQTVGKPKTDIQAERSDGDDPETLSKEAPRVLCGSDEFDQGLDDEEFLAIVSENVIPQTPAKVTPREQTNPRFCGRFLLPSTPAVPESRSLDASKSQNHAALNTTHPALLSSRVIADLDDEYPMDDDDEEEMLRLPELGAGVGKRIAPPGSVQQAFQQLDEGEVSDSSLQFSPPKSQASGTSASKVTQGYRTDTARASQLPGLREASLPLGEEEDWSFIRTDDGVENSMTLAVSDPFSDPPAPAVHLENPRRTSTPTRFNIAAHGNNQTLTTQITSESSWSIIDDSHEYEPMNPFARPDFPSLVLDRSPVVGLSAQAYLRTCFRIGEMFKEGIRCGSLNQDAVIELFARVTFSSRETGSMKQHFQFADLWHDRPPYPNGFLANYKTTGLAESESKVFLGDNGKIARCLGRFKRDMKNSVWVLHIINIRETDWEEIRWTKKIVSHGQVKMEEGWVCAKQ